MTKTPSKDTPVAAYEVVRGVKLVASTRNNNRSIYPFDKMQPPAKGKDSEMTYDAFDVPRKKANILSQMCRNLNKKHTDREYKWVLLPEICRIYRVR